LQSVLQAVFADVAGEGRTWRGEAGNQQLDKAVPPFTRARRSQRHFSGGVALFGIEMLAVQVDNLPLRNLAEPAEWIAALQIGLRNRPHRLRAHLLKHVLRLDLPPELRPKLPLDVGGQWSAAELDELSQSGLVASLKAGQEIGSGLGHQVFAKACFSCVSRRES
jgi:hypothetical protein